MLLICCLILAGGSAWAQDFLLNPQPREMKVDAQKQADVRRFRIKGEKNAIEPAWGLLEKLPKDKRQEGIEVVIGTKDDKAVRKYRKLIPNRAEGYYLAVSPQRIVLAGHDARGTYYAVKTLQQLLTGGLPADSVRATLPQLTITDYPDVSFRGIVEGFYGQPWSFEARKRMIDFCSDNKLNTYIYGPKDDPYHSTPHWRKPYPPQEAAQLKELIDKAKGEEVDFVWAIHPGQDIRWNDEDRRNVLSKFENMYQLGVRAFAVFFDDISGEGTNANRQAELLNYIDSLFVRPKHEDIKLIMCPTEYNRSWSNPAGGYLTTLGIKLHKNIQVMWTGERVVADMNRKDLEWINAQIRRPAYVWWNYPVSDYVRDHLLMGPTYGNEQGIAPLMSGFMSNPMEHAEASKVALYGVADYTWNMEAYNPQQNWQRSLTALLPDAAGAFAVFCRHNADTGENGHRYRREESTDIQPVVEQLAKSLQEGAYDKQAAMRLKQEFESIADAADILLTAQSNPWLITEIKPWLYQFRLLGDKGLDVIELAEQGAQGDTERFEEKHRHFRALEQLSYEVSQTYNQNPYQPGVQVGSRVLQPFIGNAFTTLTRQFNAQHHTSLDASAHYSPYKLTSTVPQLLNQPLQSRTNAVSISPLLEVVRWGAGQYIQLDLDKTYGGFSLQLDLGQADKALPAWVQIEVSPDGKTWQNITYEAGKYLSTPVKSIRLKNAGMQEEESRLKRFSVKMEK